MSLDNEINGILNQMHTEGTQEKGTTGEMAVTRICEEIYQNYGGILYHSYSYTVDHDLAGNIKKREDGTLYIENLGNETEIDVLLITPYKVFPIEVKAYKANKIILTDDGIEGCAITNKSPIHQNEMHCRHLYSHLYSVLPNGSTEYIVPMVCLVDKAEIIDKRSPWQKDYIKLCILNTLKDTLNKYNVPGKYKLNLQAIDKMLKEVAVGWDKYFPVRL